MRIIQRDPNTGYRSDMLWLPKSLVNHHTIRACTTAYTTSGQEVYAFHDMGTHIVVPREFRINNQFLIHDINPTTWEHINFECMAVSRDKYDIATWEKLEEQDNGVLQLACVSGDTLISINRGGKGFKIRIADAYIRYNGIASRYQWDNSIPTKIRSLVGDRVRLNGIDNIIFSGIKNTIELTFEDTTSLRCTPDHEILTPVGYVPAANLVLGDLVCADTIRTESVRKRKRAYRRLSWYRHHPFARKVKNKTNNFVIEEHRAVAEAVANGISLSEYRSRCRSGNTEGFVFIDPATHHVHHLDGDITNNAPYNLQVVLVEDHLSSHRPVYAAFGHGEVGTKKVTQITPHGLEPVYDIVCEDPHRNFVANGVIVHNCGKGKTVMALRKLAQVQAPAIILVHTTQLMGQWLERIIEFVRIDGRILLAENVGLVQGQYADTEWDKPIVIAMMQTLSNRKIPARIRRRFGLCIYDECHHLAARSWLRLSSFGFGKRLGLTATPDTESGAHVLYMMHLGEIFYTDLHQDLIPDCYFVHTSSGYNLNDPNIRDSTGAISTSKLYIALGKDYGRNRLIIKHLQRALDAGRKILVLSGSKEHCETLHTMFPDSGLCIGRIPYEDRLRTLKTKRVIFATMPLAKEGLDQQDLDTVFITTGFRRRNMLQQILGRVQRPKGMKPIALLIVDQDIPMCVSQQADLRKHTEMWGYKCVTIRE